MHLNAGDITNNTSAEGAGLYAKSASIDSPKNGVVNIKNNIASKVWGRLFSS